MSLREYPTKMKNKSYIDYTTTTLSHHLIYRPSKNNARKYPLITKHKNNPVKLTFPMQRNYSR